MEGGVASRAVRVSATGLPQPGQEREGRLLRGQGNPAPSSITTLAIIAGMLPVALGEGDGSASRASLAAAVVGGLVARRSVSS